MWHWRCASNQLPIKYAIKEVCGDPNPFDASLRGRQRVNTYLWCVECVCAPNGREKRTQRKKLIKNQFWVLGRIRVPRKRIRAPENSAHCTATTGLAGGHASQRGWLTAGQVLGAGWREPRARQGTGRSPRTRDVWRSAIGRDQPPRGGRVAQRGRSIRNSGARWMITACPSPVS